jgi:hypothetical protein
MKTIILTTLAFAAGIALAHAQGTVTINNTTAVVETNGIALAPAGGSLWNYEVLDMTAAAWSNLTALAQGQAYSLLANPTAVSLWTDSGVTGIGQNLGTHAGGINASAQTAANWAAPTSNAGYNTAANWDYYTVLGWDAALGSWATVQAGLQNGTLFETAPVGWFGQTGVAYNYAAGSGLPNPNLFGASSTGLAGSGGLPTTGALILQTTFIPEPTTLALVGLGGLSMLLLRRRKS